MRSREGLLTAEEIRTAQMGDDELGVPATLATARQIVAALPVKFAGQRWTRDLEQSIWTALDAQARHR